MPEEELEGEDDEGESESEDERYESKSEDDDEGINNLLVLF